MKIKKTAAAALGYAISAAGMLVLGMNPALAADFNSVAGNLNGQFQGAADLISGGSYLVGAALGVQAALKFREHNENPQQVKLSKPLTYAMVAGCLLALPSFLSVGSDSTFGEGTAKNGLCTGALGNGSGSGC